MADKQEIIGAVFSLFIMCLYTVGAIAVQALDKAIPVFQLNVARLAGKHAIRRVKYGQLL